MYRSRPAAWTELKVEEAAVLEFLRDGQRTTRLSPHHTVMRLLTLLAEDGCFEALCKVAATEPPRVRAILGACGEQLGKPEEDLNVLRSSLNPLSRFDFGCLALLRYARGWQARLPKSSA